MKRVILIDGHNLLFRMFYGISSPIRNSKGKDIRGLIGFVGSLKRIVDEFNPDSLLVIFDSETSKTNNLQIDESYKCNRIDYTNTHEDENPFTQLPLIKRALDYLNIMNMEVEDYEADDFIAAIVSQKSENEYIIVSTDRDFLQLVNYNVFLYVPRGKKSILYDEEEIFKKFNVLPKSYVEYKALVGDNSDNIKGIKGIGKVTASRILGNGSIDEYILNNKDSKYSKILIDNKEKISKNIDLIKLNRCLDVSFIDFLSIDERVKKLKTMDIIGSIGEK